MKIEINEQKPPKFKEYWDGQYEVFSHLEYACGIPSVLFAITTYKENGKPNICFHAWSTFQGDGSGYYALLAGIYQNTHTFLNVKRTKEFCVNFLSKQHYDALFKTISNNKDDEDEFSVGNFTIEPATLIKAPRIKESFLTLECTLEEIKDLSNAGKTALIIGKVRNIAMDEEYANGLDKKYGADGFMINIHSPINLKTGEDNTTALATLHIERTL